MEKMLLLTFFRKKKIKLKLKLNYLEEPDLGEDLPGHGEKQLDRGSFLLAQS
jgi:hypothetical protein